MADLNKPSVDSDYTEFPTELRAAIFAALSFMQGEHTNIPEGSKRWNPNSKIFETYASGQWSPMATSYNLPVEYSSLLHKPSPKTQVNSNSETDFASLKAVKIAYDKAVEASTMGGGIDESQVSNSVSSNSSATVASSKAVKIAYDRANTAYNLANEKVGNDRISSSVSSTSTTTVANSRAVKVAYDKAVSGYNLANTKIDKSKIVNNISAPRQDEVVSSYLLSQIQKQISSSIQTNINHSKTELTRSLSVTGKLNQNGYVRLSNGLLIQWFYKSGGRKVQYPIQFNEVYFVDVSGRNVYVGYYDTAKASIIHFHDEYPQNYYILAIGK